MNRNFLLEFKMKWDPDQYLKFSDERFRPAIDLISQIKLQSPSNIYDLGCGTGHLTKLLTERWPNSNIIGIDSSQEMLDVASTVSNKITWKKSDIQKWVPDDGNVDLIFSNSALHWLRNHENLFTQLFGYLNSNGVLAVQMPNNFDEKTHMIAFDLIDENQEWRDTLIHSLNKKPVYDFNFYYRLFEKSSIKVNAWQTTYYHILNGVNPVVEWVKGSFLKSFLDLLSFKERDIFIQKYSEEIFKYYPQQSDGKTILPFKRFFIIAVKS
jgi:trans-aconitate 2-methyltransferase